MDLQELWSQESDREDIQPTILPKKGKHPLQQLRRTLWLHLGYVYLISLGYLFLIYSVEELYLRLIISVVASFNGYYIWRTHQLLASQRTIGLDTSLSLLQVLKEQYSLIIQFIKQGEKMGLLFYPVSASAGMMFGAVSGSGKPLTILWLEPWFWPTLLILACILTPISHYSAKWMNKKAFGTHLERISSLIDELEQVNTNE
ncbi:MAG: hypothetical protein ACK4UP_11740 [Spirosomataceae bacterium]